MRLSSLAIFAPEWLLLLLVPVLLLMGRWFLVQRAARRLCQPELQPWMLLALWQWRVLPWRWLALWALMVLALSQPMWLSKQAQAQHQPMRWLALVDVSTSMSATDIAPNRLQQVRWALEAAAGQWQPGDQAGLLVFSGSHHWLVPITSDKVLWLSGVELLATDMLPLQGSLLLPTLETVRHALHEPTAIVLFTDGADVATADLSQWDKPVQTGLVLGIGSASGEWPLPISALHQFAKQAGWDYQALNIEKSREWLAWLQDWRSQQPLDAQAVQAGVALRPWLIGLTLLLWVSFARWPVSYASTVASFIAGVCLVLVSVVQTPVWAVDKLSVEQRLLQAQQALSEKRYAQAMEQASQAFKQAYSASEQSNALVVLAEVLIAQQQWFDAGQTLRGALAHQPNQADVEARLAYVIRHLPKPPDRSQTPAKAGVRFEGSISGWDETQLAWETKDALKMTATQSTPFTPAIAKPSDPIYSPATLLASQQQARQDWVLAGEMRQLQKDKRLFYQRLFSLESGFAVVQDKPQPVEGVDPW